jgi:hypothetical protein
MEASEDSAYLITSQVTACRCKLVRSPLHFLDENLTVQAKPNRSHLSNSEASVHHVVSPSFHGLLEVREILRCLILCDVLHHLSDIPKVSPLGIERRRVGSLGTVLFGEIVDHIVVLSGFLSILGSSSNLIIIFGEDIGDGLASIELSGSLLEKMFHLINKLIILLDIDSGVFDDEAPIFMKGFCYSLAVLGIISRLSEEVGHVDDRNHRLTEEASDV